MANANLPQSPENARENAPNVRRHEQRLRSYSYIVASLLARIQDVSNHRS